MTDYPPCRGRVSFSTCIYYAIAIFFFVYLFIYFWTSEGGPTLLAMTLVPVTFVLFVLNALREDDLYPRPAARRQLRHRCDLYRLARCSSPITCTPNITSSAPCAPATGIRPICSSAG